jgi:7-cyano-7-deazaguanine synthase in queuosine biosynthesis
MYVDKPAMYGIAKQHGYDHLLRRTWSCWYPTAAGKPCNKCLMCRERIVKTG